MKFRTVNVAPAGNPQDLQQPEDDLKPKAAQPQDAFGDEEFAEVKYKTLTWWFVFLLLISSSLH